MIALVDLDGVLADFFTARLRLAGISDLNWYNQFLGQYDLHKLLGMDRKKAYDDLPREFWANLDWMPDGKKILSLVEEKFGREYVSICTSPTNSDDCIPGKKDWIRKHLGTHYLRRTIFTQMKHHVVSPNHIIIDDYDEVIKNCARRGAKTVLVPRLWNAKHAEAKSALAHVTLKLYS
jgi:5'(3')-deoxyribonucleotidase